MKNLLSSTLNMRTGSSVEDRWYHNVNNQAELTYAATNKIDLLFKADEEWNKDTLSEYSESLLNTNFGGAVRYNQSENLMVMGELENTYDTRFDNVDKGSTAKGRIRYDGYPVKSINRIQTKFEVDADKSNLKRKKDQYAVHSEISYAHDFAEITVGANDTRTMRGYFSDIDRKNVEERRQFDQNLTFGITRDDVNIIRNKTAFELIMKFAREKTEDSANDNELSSKYRNNSEIDVKDIQFRTVRKLGRWISYGWEAGYNKNKKDVEKDIRSRTQTDVLTRGDLGITYGQSDSLSVFGKIWRTRIDTPVGVPNDRDELKIESGTAYFHKFSNNFNTTLDFRVLETHYVNIDVSQSSQNKWMKTYLLSPSLVYIPVPFLKLRHEVSLYANYIEYDFEDPLILRSNITRRVASETWIDTELSSKTLLRIGIMVEENDYGNLINTSKKIPVEEGSKRFGDVSVEYNFASWLIMTPQYIYAIRQDWEISRITKLKDMYRREIDQTYGIECKLFKNKMNNYDFIISAKRIVRNTITQPERIRNYISVTLRYGF
ncbi:MAG: hypothetical protein JXB48_06360 [Candidatus Latescibacteria bacterium]|nr:hypothetical protein [Candidatus Latescibacterota bacterium]